MNSLIIASRLLKSKLKSTETYIIYLAFPIVLIAILGFAFSKNFEDFEISGSVIYYFEESTEYTKSVEERFKYLQGVTFTEIEDLEKGRSMVSRGVYDLLIYIDGTEIELIHDQSIVIRSSVEALLNYSPENFVEKRTLPRKSEPGALDFYGLSIMTMMIIYGAYISAYGIIEERKAGTLSRVTTAPVKKYEYFLGISIGSIAQIMIQNIIIIVIGYFLLGINYGTRPIAFGLIILSHSFMVVSLGFFFAINIKDSNVVNGLINIGAQILVFLGGGYFQLPESGIMNTLSKLSPIYWVNNGLLEAVNLNSNNYVYPAIGITLGLGFILFIFSQIRFIKGE